MHRKLTAALDRTVVTATLATALLATPLALPAVAQLQPTQPVTDPVEDAVTGGTEAVVDSCAELTEGDEPTAGQEPVALPQDSVDPADEEACETAEETADAATAVTGPVQDAAPPAPAESPAAAPAPGDDGVQAAGGGVTPIPNVDRMAGDDGAPTFTEDGPALSGATGFRSSSAPTLQPVLAPIVSAPFVYELPQVAGQLWEGMTRTAATATGAGHLPAEGTSTGWLVLVTAGFLSLVAGSYVVAARTRPSEATATD